VVALVPTWRAETYILQTLESLAAQTFQNLEILISDDASPDQTAAVCERFAARDPRFHVFRQPRNLGWVGNVNALLERARGDYLLFAFQDDLPAPFYIERCVAALERNPAAVLAFSDITLANQDGSREEKTYAVLEGITDPLGRARLIAKQKGSWWIPNRGVFRGAAARRIGGLRRHAAGEFSADWPWLLHMSLLGEFARVPENLCTKIYQPRSLSRGWDFGARSWLSVTRSAMAVVSRSDLGWADRMRLHGTLIRFAGGRLRRSIRRAPGRALRGLRLLPARPDEAPPPGKAGRFTG